MYSISRQCRNIYVQLRVILYDYIDKFLINRNLSFLIEVILALFSDYSDVVDVDLSFHSSICFDV